ncbi:MAG TPA: DUF2092 domain-containing protein [Leptolyngbyaceae cyanobacterium M65_K2018_010]|nr:DUF2092 domain-containing protein [Leptolyngbyaceae cyanobacterium M65_K2018_010]
MATVLVATPALAQASPTIDPFADGLLRDMGAYIDEANAFTVEVQTEVDELSPRGQKIQYASTIGLAVRGNNRMYVYEVGDLRDRTLWFNGDTFTVLDRDLGHYVVVDTPNNIADAILFLEDTGVVFPLSDFVTGSFYEGVTTNIQTGDYLGLHQVGDQLCHHLAFTQANVDWQIWIADGFEIVPCKLLITYKNLPESPQYTAYFGEWVFEPRLPDRLFNFVPPAGTSQIEFVPRQ